MVLAEGESDKARMPACAVPRVKDGRLVQLCIFPFTCRPRPGYISAMGEPSQPKNNQLVLSALGADQPGIIDALSSSILESGCSIVDSRMSVLGGDFAILLLIDGNWSNLARLENQLPGLETRLGLTISRRRTSSRKSRKDRLPYRVDVITLDQPGIVHNLAGFFSSRHINIQEMVTSGYAAPHTGAPMFSVCLSIEVPASTQIAALREEFMDFCDTHNLDAVLEPDKE